MILTTAQQQTLRTRPHRTKLWLSIYTPSTVFSCKTTGSIQFGETDIDYSDIITGSITKTYPNMTVLIGTSYGSDDVGRIRLRSATGSSIIFAENNVIWANGQYLTFIDYVNIEAVFPKIIQDPNDSENVIFYKDNDIEYSSQNSTYGSFPCAGSHRAVMITTGSASLYWTATGSYNVAGNSMTYLWSFGGGTPTGSTALTPGYVSYSTPGHYKTTLTVTSSGSVDTTYRYVSVYNRPENGSNTPILKWTLNDLSGSRSEGGYLGTIRVWQNLGSIEPNALVVIFADDWYGSTKTSLGGNSQNSSEIVFVGYIMKNSIQFNYREGWAEFDIGSVTQVMKESEGFSVSCESKASPTTWFQLKNMTVYKALYHYLRWHSTVLNVTDFQYTGDDRLVQYFDTDRSSIYDAVNSFVSEGVFGEIVSDRQGKIWAEISPIGYENPIDSIPYSMTLHKHDWIGEPNISQRRTAEVSFVEMGGIVYEGTSTDGYQALLSNAPSITPLYRGKSDSPRQGLILNGQTQLNKISGNYLASMNSKFEDVTLSLAGNYRNFDIVPQERIYLLIDSNDTTIGQSLIGYPFRFTSMNWNYKAEDESFYAEATLEQISTGTSAQTVVIPPVPPDDGYTYPSIELPPFPDFPYTPATQPSSTTVLAAEASGGLFYTTNFDSDHPTWVLWNNGIDSSDVAYIRNNVNTSLADSDCDVFVTPNGAVYVGVRLAPAPHVKTNKVYRAPYIGGTFEVVLTESWIKGLYGTNTGYIRAIGFDPSQPERVGFVTSYDIGFGANLAHDMYIGSATSWTKGSTFVVRNGDDGGMSWGENEWVWDNNDATNEKFVIMSNNGTFIQEGTNSGQGDKAYHRRAGTSKILMKKITLSNKLARSLDNGRTQTTITLSDYINGQIAISPGGSYLIGNWSSSAHKGRSADGGYSWSALSGILPMGVNPQFAYCSGENTSSKWIAGRGAIYYTSDWGSNSVDKTGNLLELFPSGATITKFISFLETES